MTICTFWVAPAVLLLALFGFLVYQPFLFSPSHSFQSSYYLFRSATSRFPLSFANSSSLNPSQPPSDPLQLPSPMATKKTASVIFSHGLGDTSAGWSYLADMYSSRMPWINWVFPNAPIQPVTLNGGMPMPSWFDIMALDSAAPHDKKGLLASVALIGQHVQREIDNGIPPERIIVGGFSQGAVIGILTGLTSPHKLAGSICLSGFLPLTNDLKELRTPHSEQLPVFWAHGTDDPTRKWIRSYSWGKQSVEFLVNELGMKRVDFKTYSGIGHGASPKEISDMIAWISTTVPSSPSPA